MKKEKIEQCILDNIKNQMLPKMRKELDEFVEYDAIRKLAVTSNVYIYVLEDGWKGSYICDNEGKFIHFCDGDTGTYNRLFQKGKNNNK